MNLCRASIFLVLSCAVTFVQADVDKRFYKKRTMGLDLRVRDGLGPTPVNSFDPVNTKFLEAGKKEDLKKYFDFPENMSAVALKDGKLVYERYNEKRGFDDKFLAHGMSMTKTAVGLVIGHLLCDGKISSLEDTLGIYSNGLANSVYKDVTIKNVLRMASGVNKNRDNEQGLNQTLRNRFQDGSNDQLAVIQSVKTIHSEQGKDSRYHTLDVTAASVLVNEITGKSVDEIFYDKIYSQIAPEGKMIWWADKNGHSLGMAGLYMTTRDWARMGQYMVNEMRAESCIGKFLKDGLDNAIKTTARDYQRYGFFFWVSKIGGKQVVVLTGKGGQVMIPNHYNDSVAVVISASNFKYKKKDLLKDIMPNVTKKFGKMGW